MANSLTSLNPYFWAKAAERSLFVENKAMAIANTTLRNLVAGEGSLVYRNIISYPASTVYTPGTDINSRALSSTSESLSIATWFASLVTIDDTEKRQSIIELGANVANKMMQNHNNQIEQAVMSQVTNAQWTLDDGNVGGTSGNNAVINTGNVPQLFTAADTKLDATDAPKAGRTAVIGTHILNTLKLQQAGRNTIFGDGVNTRGVVTNMFGWDILYSNNLPYSAKLVTSVIPVAGNTVTIAGVTFTFTASGAATVAGDVSIGTVAAEATTYLVAAINYNDGKTATAVSTAAANAGTVAPVAGTFIDLSSENRFILRDKRRITATDATTYILISGYGDIVVSETITSATDVWSAQRQDALFCVSGCIDQIVQIPPRIEVVRDPDQFSDIVKSMVGYGVKTFADGAREMVRVKIDASTADWS